MSGRAYQTARRDPGGAPAPDLPVLEWPSTLVDRISAPMVDGSPPPGHRYTSTVIRVAEEDTYRPSVKVASCAENERDRCWAPQGNVAYLKHLERPVSRRAFRRRGCCSALSPRSCSTPARCESDTCDDKSDESSPLFFLFVFGFEVAGRMPTVAFGVFRAPWYFACIQFT
jgi:hypothetical protein